MFSNINNIVILKNEPLSKHCSFKVGGNTKYFILVHNIDALLDVLNRCNQHSVKFKIIGGGSNILFDDKGYNGAIIKYVDDNIFLKNNTLYASSGCNIPQVIQFCAKNNLGGLEFAIGVPAQLGGAIINNLGAYGSEISTFIEHITILQNNRIVYLHKDDCNFTYHSSNFQHSKDIILSATFNLPPQDESKTQIKLKDYLLKRSLSQPLEYPNAGSIFKRTPDVIPAQLIDHANLKGFTIGEAQISTKHAGFIVNLGNATSKNILDLINLVYQTIFTKHSIHLIPEIEYVPY